MSPELRIYDVSVMPLPGGDHECKASVEVNESGPYKFTLTIPVSCHDPIICGFRQKDLFNEPGLGKSDIPGPIQLQRAFSNIFDAAIRQYIDVLGNAIKPPTESRLRTLDTCDVSPLITRCYRAHLARQQMAKQKTAGN
jgi:hypothetical protein